MSFEINLPAGIRSRRVPEINGLDMHVLEAGFEVPGKPLILLLHDDRRLFYWLLLFLFLLFFLVLVLVLLGGRVAAKPKHQNPPCE